MTRSATILAYHAVERGPAPLCIDPQLFRAQIDCLAELGVPSLTVRELAGALVEGSLPERCVAITFDDGFASVAETAAPLLGERGQRATVFGVAGYLGGSNDWPTNHPGAPRSALADSVQLRALAEQGLEIGSHGTEHEPLARPSTDVLRRELIDSKRILEEATGAPITSFAYPYGVVPGRDARALVKQAYAAACLGGFRPVRPGSDPLALTRVDVHYLHRPSQFRAAVLGSPTAYLAARRVAARARRLVRKDYAPAETR